MKGLHSYLCVFRKGGKRGKLLTSQVRILNVSSSGTSNINNNYIFNGISSILQLLSLIYSTKYCFIVYYIPGTIHESGDVTTKNKQNHGPFYGLVLIHKHNE